MRTKAFFIMILALLAALIGAAQEVFVVYEGATTTHNVSNNPGNSYRWEMYKDFSPDILADNSEYDFISPPTLNPVSVNWKLPGVYYLKVTETDPGGCTNLKVLPVNVLPNNRTIGFAKSVSKTCVSLGDNSYDLLLDVMDNNGLPLEAKYFPLTVDFSLNGVDHSQELFYTNQVLEIKDEWIVEQHRENSIDEIQLKKASDVSGLPIWTDTDTSVHNRTHWASPEIDFLSDNISILQGESFDHVLQLISGEPLNANYSWSVSPAGGTSTNETLIHEKNATILWDGELGSYEVQVYVTDGNSCISETITRNVQVVSPGNLVFNATHPNSLTCSDLQGGKEGTVPLHTQSIFNVLYEGEQNLVSAKITIKNPEGKYIAQDGAELPDQQNPEIEITNSESGKNLTFAISDNWENTIGETVEFEIKLISGITSDQQEIQVVDGTDIKRTISVLKKPVIEFKP